MSRSTGRPKQFDTKLPEISCSTAQKEAYLKAAGTKPLARWARDVLDAACKGEAPPEPVVVSPRNTPLSEARERLARLSRG